MGESFKQLMNNKGIEIQTNQGMCWVATFMITVMIVMYPKFTPMTLNKILSPVFELY